MSTRTKRMLGLSFLMLVLVVLGGIAYVLSPRAPSVEVSFLGYTNSISGDLSAALEIRNRGKERVARNSCRISPAPADTGYWYAADVPSHGLEPNETERLVLTFEPRRMTRWRATIIYVRNPTAAEYRLMSCVDWLGDHGLAPSALRRWRDGLAGGQVETDWIAVPGN